MPWTKLQDRLPALGKLVYTKTAAGYIAAHMRYEFGWMTKLNDARAKDNSPIVEWLDPEEEMNGAQKGAANKNRGGLLFFTKYSIFK